MALKKSLNRRPARLPRDHVPRQPHPSWRLAPAGLHDEASLRMTSAADFWERLGL